MPSTSSPRIPVVRPRLKDGITPLWRDGATIQVGLDAQRATVVGDVTHRTASVLGLLDGTRTRDDITAEAGRGGTFLLETLEESGLVEDAAAPLVALLPDLDDDARSRCRPEIAALALACGPTDHAASVFAQRRERRVLVHGAGRVGTAVAHLLAAAGIGRVTVEDTGRVTPSDVCPGAASVADVGLRRGAAATALTVRALPPALGVGSPDVVVLCPDRPVTPDPEVAVGFLDGGAAVLPVVLRESTAIVGPLSVPAQLDVGGCPRCVERHRAERDPSWPTVSRQLRRSGVPGPAGATVVWATAALAVTQVLDLLDRQAGGRSPDDPDGPVACLGASLELAPPAWTWRRRWWGPHPACTCANTRSFV